MLVHTFFWRYETKEDLRLMRSALNTPTRSPALISFLLSSSSTTFSATTEKLLVFRSKRNAPEHIRVAFKGLDHRTRPGWRLGGSARAHP